VSSRPIRVEQFDTCHPLAPQRMGLGHCLLATTRNRSGKRVGLHRRVQANANYSRRRRTQKSAGQVGRNAVGSTGSRAASFESEIAAGSAAAVARQFESHSPAFCTSVHFARENTRFPNNPKTSQHHPLTPAAKHGTLCGPPDACCGK